MRLRTKVIALAIVTVFLASVGAASIASAQVPRSEHSYDTTLITRQAIEQITGPSKVFEPGKGAWVWGELQSGYVSLPGKTVKVYVQRLGSTSIFGREIGRSSAPVLVATTTTSTEGLWAVEVAFNQVGDYQIYATFAGATDESSSTYYRPSQTGMTNVKVTKLPDELFQRKLTNSWLECNIDNQVTVVHPPYAFFAGHLQSGSTEVFNKKVSLYYQYKASASDAWGARQLFATSQTGSQDYATAVWEFHPSTPGLYRFQMTFAGDPAWRWGGYGASASNYVDVLVTDQIITPPS